MTAPNQEIMDALQFVKVTVENARETAPFSSAGYLTDMSCRTLLVELERRGYRLIAEQ